MRALAVLLVLVWHAEVPGISAGYVGVDVFFVISGFLITGLLVRERTENGWIDLRRFYSRRALRLLPAAGLTLLVTLIASWFLLPNTRWSDVSGDAFASVFYFQNWNLSARSVSYVAQDAAPSPFQHYWSLSVEEQFYFVWPLLLILVTPRGSLYRGVLGRNLVIAVSSVIAASFVWSLYYSFSNPSAAYFVTTTRVWQLAAGALVAICWPVLDSVREGVREGVRMAGGWIGLIAILVAAVAIDKSTVFPGWWALAPTLGAVGLLIAGPSSSNFSVSKFLGWRPLQEIGNVSYALYLWHWPAVVFVLANNPDADWGLLLAAEAATIPLAIVSTKYFEPLFRHLPTVTLRAPLGVAIGSTALVVVAAFGLQAVIPGSEVSEAAVQSELASIQEALQAAPAESSTLSPPEPSLEAVPTSEAASSPEVAASPEAEPAGEPEAELDDAEPAQVIPLIPQPASQFGGLALWPDPMTSSERVQGDNPETITPLPSSAEDDRGAFNRCQRDFEATEPELCSAGDLTSETSIALVGDSHARQWSDAFSLIAESRSQRLDIYAKGACPYADIDLMRLAEGSIYTSCTEWNANVREILLANPPAIAIFSGVDHDVSVGGAILSGSDAHLAHGEAYSRLWAELRALGVQVVALADTPRPSIHVPDCVAANRLEVSNCVFAPENTGRAIEEAARLSAVPLIDMNGWICPGGEQCPVVVGGVLIYRDRTHVSTTYTTTLAPVLSAFLNDALATSLGQ